MSLLYIKDICSSAFYWCQSPRAALKCHIVTAFFRRIWLILLCVVLVEVKQLPAYYIEQRQLQTIKELCNVSLSEWRRNCQACFVCQLSLIIVELWSICSWPIYLWTPHTFTFFFLLFFPLTLLYTCLCLLKKVRFYFLPNSCCLILSLFFCISCLSWEFCCFARLLCFTTVKSAAHVQIIPNNTHFFY